MTDLVTGGAGFIGSRVAERLVEEGREVLVVDNLSSGRRNQVPGDAGFAELDLASEPLEEAVEGAERVFHFAANPSVRAFPDDRESDFRDNLVATRRLLDACADAGIDDFVFASSSVVYGEDPEIPTPEDAALDPISMYAATKCGCEHISEVYADRFGFDLTVLRYANILGGRNRKGVVYDFVRKLEEDGSELEILGDGRQRKSYLHIDDAVEATLVAEESGRRYYNVGSEDAISVDRIAELVSEEMGLDPEFVHTGGRKGWEGDVPEMRLSVERLKSEGWSPENGSEQSVRLTVRELLDQE